MKVKSKSVIASVFIIGILGLGFLSVFSFSITNAAITFNPYIIALANNTCGGCANPFNEFGAVTTSILPAGTGLVNTIRCSNNVTVSSITDTISDVWVQVISVSTLGNPPSYGLSAGANSYKGFMWYTNMATTAVTITFTITFSGLPGNCYFELFNASTGLSLTTFSGSSTYMFTSSNGLLTKLTALNQFIGGSVVTTVPSAMVFEVSWLNESVGEQALATPVYTQQNNLGFVSQVTLGVGPHSYLETNSFYGYFVASTKQTFQVNYRQTLANTSPNNWYGLGIMIAYFTPTNIQNAGTCTGLSCKVTGGGTQISTTQYSLTANTTYYYVAYSGNGGINIYNISSKIASYTNAALHKENDTIQITVYLSSCSANGQPVFSFSCPYTNYGSYAQQFGVHTGITNVWLHSVANQTSINIPANSLYVVAIISKYTGLNIYQAINSQPMYNTTEGLFINSDWIPPQTITIQKTNPSNLFLEWFGTENVGLQTLTSTSTTITSCSSGQTCNTATATQINTQTTLLYSRSAGATPTNDIQDLETYFPVWILPILFSPFGIQGVLVGFLMGVILGALLGIIPLWAAFLLSMGILYVMLKRG